MTVKLFRSRGAAGPPGTRGKEGMGRRMKGTGWFR